MKRSLVLTFRGISLWLEGTNVSEVQSGPAPMVDYWRTVLRADRPVPRTGADSAAIAGLWFSRQWCFWDSQRTRVRIQHQVHISVGIGSFSLLSLIRFGLFCFEVFFPHTFRINVRICGKTQGPCSRNQEHKAPLVSHAGWLHGLLGDSAWPGI